MCGAPGQAATGSASLQCEHLFMSQLLCLIQLVCQVLGPCTRVGVSEKPWLLALARLAGGPSQE